MKPCTNCNGEGLVGQGDQPWLKHGRIETCPKCGGTGKVPDGTLTEPAEKTGVPEKAAPESTTVDNSTSPKGDGSQDSSGGDADQQSGPAQG